MQLVCWKKVNNLTWVHFCFQNWMGLMYMSNMPHLLASEMTDLNCRYTKSMKCVWLFLWVTSIWFRAHECNLESYTKHGFITANKLDLNHFGEWFVNYKCTGSSAQQIISKATACFIPVKKKWQFFVTETDSVDSWECRPDVRKRGDRLLELRPQY